MSIKIIKSMINGQEIQVNDKTAHYLESFHPITQELITRTYLAEDLDIEEAFTSSEQGYQIWKSKTLKERASYLFKIAQILREKNLPLAIDESLDTGKAISETSVVDILSAAECFDYFASLCLTDRNSFIEGADYLGHIKRSPLGICVCIGAWNYPLQIASWKIAPALAMGNSVIFRPSELTPRGAYNLGKIIHEAALPDGVVNILFGDRDVAEKLVRHPKTKKVSLTGSVATGKKVYAMASADFKNVSVELGGKSPLIIFEDADIEEAVKGAILANFYSSGQICCNGTRVFVHEKIYDKFLEKVKERSDKIVLGDPLDLATQMGPLVNRKQADRVLFYIQEGLREGAKLLVGGVTHPFQDHPQLKNAAFVSPTIFYDVEDEMRIAKEEIFGPVMSILKFRDQDEVIRRANQSAFGLAAGIFTQNLNRAYQVERELESGFVWINTYNLTPPEFPFGGFKDSGKGRENGVEALASYSQMKSVYVQNGPIVCDLGK